MRLRGDGLQEECPVPEVGIVGGKTLLDAGERRWAAKEVPEAGPLNVGAWWED